MIDHRPLAGLPKANIGWLNARHHFPVDGRADPHHTTLKSLYVWNDDEFAPRHGFPLHYHQNVEIITYVRSGAVTHEDTLGNSYEIAAGDIQVMSTGTGLRHAEFNRGSRPLRIFQIWLAPNQLGGTPAYAARRFPGVDRSNQLVVLASGLPQDTTADVVPLRADARLLAGRLEAGRSLRHEMGAGHNLYLVPSTGKIRVDGVMVEAGDGVAVVNQTSVEFEAAQDTELVVVELV
jgi:redox-sensitive bicupin YhaK (pirin superfamily)